MTWANSNAREIFVNTSIPTYKGFVKYPKTLLQDKEYVALYKPAGWLVYGEAPSVTEWNYSRGGGKLFPVHRLDKDTEGVLLYGKSADFASRLTRLFETKKIRKTYLAWSLGSPEHTEGKIRIPLRKKSSDPEQSARTDYRVLKTLEVQGMTLTLFALEPKTGRFHQIRKHLKGIGCPIVGDSKYLTEVQYRALTKALGPHPMCLCAASLEFAHPKTGKPVRITSAPQWPKKLMVRPAILRTQSSST